MDDRLIARFWSKVDKRSPDECWLWQAARLTSGYGQFRVGRRMTVSHRVAWQIANGPIPEARFVCHRCDNPPCCNPAHLFLGTPSDNTRDMYMKDRYPVRRGAEATRSKLSEDDVRTIRALRAAGTQLSTLAERFGVSIQNVHGIVHRRHWRHIG